MTELSRNSDLVELLEIETNDYVTVRDVSDTTSQATGETKWIKVNNLNLTVAGSFTCASGYNISSIFNTNVRSSSAIIFSPTNSAAALAVSGAPSPFVSTLHPGPGFLFSTMNGSHFVGEESFNYFVFR